jgi:hypothetical protein
MMKKLIFILVFLCAAWFSGMSDAQQTQTEPTTPQVDEKADQLLRKMSDTLANAKTFTLRTKEVHDKVRSTGKVVQAQITREVAVRRPDRVWMHLVSQAPDQNRELNLWYDGKVIILQSDKEKVFARAKMPPTIDEALDYIGTTLNVPTPMGDMLYSSPYESFMSDDAIGRYVKLDKVGEKSCHELAFQNPILDWKVWIQDGEQALPCRLDITYKLDYGSPTISMTFLDWNFGPQLAANQFTHEPPQDYKKIKIIGRVPMKEEAPAGENPQSQTQENPQTQEN